MEDNESTDPLRHQRDLFEQALGLEDLEERAAFLNDACKSPEIRREVDALLAAEAQAPDAFLEAETVADLESKVLEGPGTVICSYRLLEKLGEGGFGTVYLAQQSKPIKRKVALKIIKLGMDTREVVARFEAERQALGLMDHPNVAQVYDGGATETGRPYFVMELVNGLPITDYCDEHKLSIRERLVLFMDVCRAVQHAHQKGIIHRDLKPSNILVTIQEDKPVPKVIDFGVAKAVSMELTEKTLFTVEGQMIGTPQYMSPEQAGMGGIDVDTRSDIYSLGVLLYELLTGTTPLQPKQLREAGFAAIEKLVQEEESPKPSTRITTLGEELSTIAEVRKAEPAKLGKLVRGDLDWIVMKALEKDRSRRYESATGFTADIQNYLTDEPVQASPPSASYRLRKFSRRNKGALVGATLVLVAMVGGTVSTALQAVRATAQAKRAAAAEALAVEESESAKQAEARAVLAAKLAEEAREKSEAARRKLEEISVALVTVSEGEQYADEGINIEEDLDHLLKSIESLASLHQSLLDADHLSPLSQAFLMEKFATMIEYHRGRLGGRTKEVSKVDYKRIENNLYRREIELKERILRLCTDVQGQDHRDTLLAATTLARAMQSADKERSLVVINDTVERLTKAFGASDKDTVSAMAVRASILSLARTPREAAAQYLKLLNIQLAKDGNSYSASSYARALADQLMELKRPDLAIPFYQFYIKVGIDMTQGYSRRRSLMLRSPAKRLAEAYAANGDTEMATKLQNPLASEEFLKNVFDRLEFEKARTAVSRMLLEEGDPRGPSAAKVPDQASIDAKVSERALVANEAALEHLRKDKGPTNPETLTQMGRLAYAYSRAGEDEKAEALYIEKLAILRKTLRPDDPFILPTFDGLASTCRKLGKYEAAKALYIEKLAIQRRALGPAVPSILPTLSGLASTCRKLEQHEEAIRYREEALEISRIAHGEENTITASVIHFLAHAYTTVDGKEEEAILRFNEAVDLQGKLSGPTDSATIKYMTCLANAYEEYGRVDESKQLRDEIEKLKDGKAAERQPSKPHPVEN